MINDYPSIKVNTRNSGFALKFKANPTWTIKVYEIAKQNNVKRLLTRSPRIVPPVVHLKVKGIKKSRFLFPFS